MEILTPVKEGFRVVIPEEKMILQRNQLEIDRLERSLPVVTAAFNKALAELQKLNVGEFSIDDVVHAVQGIKPLERQVRERMATGPVTIQGMVFSVEKVREMLEIPNVAPANQALSKFKQTIDGIIMNAGQSLQGTLAVGNFEITDFTASFKQEAMQKFVDHHSVLAVTDEEKEAALLVADVQDKIDYLAEKYGLAVLSGNAQVLSQKRGSNGVFKVELNPAALKSHMYERERVKRSQGYSK